MQGYGGFLKRWVSPTTMGFPTRNDQHLGCEMEVLPSFKETSIFSFDIEMQKLEIDPLEACFYGKTLW